MDKVKPMLCEDAPDLETTNEVLEFIAGKEQHIWETKYDGARIVAHVNCGIGSGIKLFGRSGKEKTGLFPELRIETKVSCILDGEVISGDNFSDVQRRINRQYEIGLAAKNYPAIFKVFDVLWVETPMLGVSFQAFPLMKRKAVLAEVLVPTDNVHIGEFTEDGASLFKEVKDAHGEGIVGKLKAGAYRQDKRGWLKVKNWKRNYGPESTGEVFLAVGYTKGTGKRAPTFGALVLARLEANGESTFVGEVGTGFDDDELKGIKSGYFISSVCPFPKEPEPATWIKPFAIKIRYLEYTNDGMLRFPSFKGIV